MSNDMFLDAAHACSSFGNMSFLFFFFFFENLPLSNCVCPLSAFYCLFRGHLSFRIWPQTFFVERSQRVDLTDTGPEHFSFLSQRRNDSGRRQSRKQPLCKSWACILAVFGVLIGWVNSFVVQLKHCVVCSRWGLSHFGERLGIYKKLNKLWISKHPGYRPSH